MSYYSDLIVSYASLQAYYRMDETSGNVVHDLSGHGYHGILSGTFTLGQPGAIANDGDFSTALDGTTGVVSLPWNQLNITTWTALTLEFWIELSGEWEYVAVTAVGTATIVYRNGAAYTPDPTAPTEIDQGFSWAGSALSGNLDDIGIYNAALSPADIATNYTAGTTWRMVDTASVQETDTLSTTLSRTEQSSTTESSTQSVQEVVSETTTTTETTSEQISLIRSESSTLAEIVNENVALIASEISTTMEISAVQSKSSVSESQALVDALHLSEILAIVEQNAQTETASGSTSCQQSTSTQLWESLSESVQQALSESLQEASLILLSCLLSQSDLVSETEALSVRAILNLPDLLTASEAVSGADQWQSSELLTVAESFSASAIASLVFASNILLLMRSGAINLETRKGTLDLAVRKGDSTVHLPEGTLDLAVPEGTIATKVRTL